MISCVQCLSWCRWERGERGGRREGEWREGKMEYREVGKRVEEEVVEIMGGN